MAQSIKSLIVGSVITHHGQDFKVVAKNHYGSKEVTLMMLYPTNKAINQNYPNVNYIYSDINYFLSTQGGLSAIIDPRLEELVKITNVHYVDCFNGSIQQGDRVFQAKYFLPSRRELCLATNEESGNTNIREVDYFRTENARALGVDYWTRTERSSHGGSDGLFYSIHPNGGAGSARRCNESIGLAILFNVQDTLLVSDNVSNGKYSFVFNQPPTIGTIPNMAGNYGSATEITYTVSDKDSASLTHYFSQDNGRTWTQIVPTHHDNIYVYRKVFNMLGTYDCRIRVSDGQNETVSNWFTITVDSAKPTIYVQRVYKGVLTLKASCKTHSISKVEVLINGVLRKTFTTGLDFDLTYEIDRAHLTQPTNTIELRATSSADLEGSRFLQAKKDSYALPPVGTRLRIGEQEYTIEAASQEGTNQVYTLDRNLMSGVVEGQSVFVMQDKVTVKCCLSNIDNATEYKDMKVTKIKKLKGDFEGYVEERYELEGEGRYSTIKLELERFNNDVESEIIELQQHFDYMED